MSRSTENKTESQQSGLTCLRLLIAGDQPRVRQSLDALFTALSWSESDHPENFIKIVGKADDGQQAVAQVAALQPHVVVLDLPSQNIDGLASIRTIKDRWPAVRIVVLTMYATDRSAVLLAGADSFLLKGCPAGELLDAVIEVV